MRSANAANAGFGKADDAEAKALLAPVYDWFSGGFDKPDLMEAKAVLDGLG